MRNEWKTESFENCIEKVIYPRKIQRKDFLASGAHPVVSQEEEFINGYWDNEADLFHVTAPVVVFGDHTKVLKYVDFDFALGADGVKILRPRQFLLPKFFFYQLQAASLNSLGYARHYKLLRELEIAYPPLPEQQRIVGILDEAFEGIATAKANAERNLQNVGALFESHLQSVFAERGKGWTESTIGEVAEVFDGPHATPKTVDAGPVFLGISALQDGRINLGETRHVTPEDFRRWTRRIKPHTDDVVFSYETRLGQAAIIPSGLECCLGRRMGLVRPNRKRLDPRFFVYQYISPPFRAFLDSRTVRGATVDRIALKEFPSFPIRLPKLHEQERMAAQFESLREETERLGGLYERKLTALEALKRSLLHEAFTGKL